MSGEHPEDEHRGKVGPRKDRDPTIRGQSYDSMMECSQAVITLRSVEKKRTPGSGVRGVGSALSYKNVKPTTAWSQSERWSVQPRGAILR